MREHQIVITLKPEQFVEIQRMARLSGAKSMGMFVRQSLLSALGIDGQSPVPSSLSAGPDVKRVTSELRRLHAELKTFVAESLNNAYMGPEVEPNFMDSLYQDGALSQPAASALASFKDVEETMAEFEQARDELEQMAQKAFAISPRLGPMEDSQQPAQAPGSEPEPGGESGKEKAQSGRDPLDELLEDPLMARLDAYAKRSRGVLAAKAAEDSEGQEADEPEEEEEIFDVPLPMSERPARQTQGSPEQNKEEPPPAPPPPPPPPPPRPGSGPPPTGLSGGPPPRRRQ